MYRLFQSNSYSDSDYEGEPVTKHPRLSGKYRNHQDSYSSDDSSSIEDDTDELGKTEGMQRTALNKGMISNEIIETKKNDDSLIIDSFASFPDDTSQFTKYVFHPCHTTQVLTPPLPFRSNRKAPNLGTYYFKHEDTDSEMERLKKLKQQPPTETVEETSEDEWTYSKVDKQNAADQNKIAASKSMLQNLHRIIQEAEELVSPDKKKMKAITAPINKITRVKEWLDMERPEDSCDASGEDDGQESQVSEDLCESVSTFRAAQENGSHNTSFTELDSTDSTPKVALRHNKYILKGNRPRSVSCISQLSQATSSPK